MPKPFELLLERLDSTDKDLRYKAFTELIQTTNKPVPWAYKAWDQLIRLAQHGDNHQRAIGVQLMANLTKSDIESRILKDINKLVQVTKDPMFVTARHSLLCLWKIGIKDAEHQRVVMAKLTKRFKECIAEKNCTLVRYDIQTVMKKMYVISQDEKVRSQALKLMKLETDSKYKKKYGTVWR
jgi:hypothetical protein